MAYIIPTLSDFRTMFPELSDKSDNLVTFWLVQADPFFNLERWDDLLFMGMLNWTAHQIVKADANAKSPVFDDALMKKVGDIAKTRSEKLMQTQSDNPYMRTYYGQVYYNLMVGLGGAQAT